MDTVSSGANENISHLQDGAPVIDPLDPVASRREALIKMGKFAAYTAPALAILLTAGKSEGTCTCSGCQIGSGKCCHSSGGGTQCGVPDGSPCVTGDANISCF